MNFLTRPALRLANSSFLRYACKRSSSKHTGGDEYDAMRYNRAKRLETAISKDVFEDQSLKNEKTFKDAIDLFNNKGARKRGSVEFIDAALKHMKEYDVHR